jgi:biopolymer transport protein ExbD
MDAGPAPEISSAVPFESNALIPRKPFSDDARFDITAMVDLVFMMNIYFLVTWTAAAMAEIDLPVARRCLGASQDDCLVISVLKGPKVYKGEPTADSLMNPSEVDQRITAAVEEAIREQKKFILIKAEKEALLRDVVHVAGVATATKGLKLMVAVMQKDTE